jgi:hypothetical protein
VDGFALRIYEEGKSELVSHSLGPQFPMLMIEVFFPKQLL